MSYFKGDKEWAIIGQELELAARDLNPNQSPNHQNLTWIGEKPANMELPPSLGSSPLEVTYPTLEGSFQRQF